MAQLDILRNPVRIGHVETRNRIYLPAHQPSFAPPEYGAYLAERARGGVGLIVTHGFHVHETGSCGTNEKDGKKVAAGAAGGHFDPVASKHHAGPSGDGHLGDLPALVVNDSGAAGTAVTAPRLTKLSEVKGKALMIHAGGDNFSDQPKPLGGGGERIACGVIE